MKHKTISSQSGKLLSFFNREGKVSFDNNAATKALPESGENAVNELLSDMVKRGLLMRLKEGVYYIIPYEADAKYFIPEWHVVAAHLVQGTEYYIGYYSALQIHNLITQPSLKEQIVVAKQIRSSVVNIKTVSFQFIYHNPTHFFGAKKIWINDFSKVPYSDMEKTIVDCLFKPDYAGGIVEITRTIYTSKKQIDFDKLLEYTKKFESQAVIKRLGFLLELLQIDNAIVDKLQRIKSASYVLLDTELLKAGKMISRWSIQQNIDTETILSSVTT